jgi:hypothetical protein
MHSVCLLLSQVILFKNQKPLTEAFNGKITCKLKAECLMLKAKVKVKERRID